MMSITALYMVLRDEIRVTDLRLCENLLPINKTTRIRSNFICPLFWHMIFEQSYLLRVREYRGTEIGNLWLMKIRL